MPISSTYPNIELPETDLWTILFDPSLKRGPEDKEIFIDTSDTSRSFTLSSLRQATIHIADALITNFHFKKGDVLGLYSPNDVDYPVIALGVMRAGGILCPIPAALNANEVAFQLKDADVKVLVTHASLVKAAKIAARATGLDETQMFVLGARQVEGTKHWTDLPVNRVSRSNKVGPHDTAVIGYSSGTTGLPKGVVLSHRNITASLLSILAVWKDSRPSSTSVCSESWKARFLGFLPLSHIYGLAALVLLPIHELHSIYIMPQFSFESSLQIIQRHRITCFPVVPPVLLLFAKHPLASQYDLSSLQGFVSAAAPLTKDLIAAVWERLKIPVIQAYGLTETAPVITSQPWSRSLEAPGSVGVIAPNVIVKWVKADDKETTRPDEEAELWCRGPNVFSSYLNRPEESSGSFHTDTEGQKWFKTGDIGHMDDRGNVYITDRVKELIKYKGYQVAPAELEGLIAGHHKVIDVAVLGVWKEEIMSEVPRAYIVVEPGTKEDKELEKTIVDWVNRQVANHKKLRGGIEWVDSVPKSPTGKILRRVLREQYIRKAGDGQQRPKI